MDQKKIIYILSGVLVLLLGVASFLGYSFYKANSKLEEANNVIQARVDEIQSFDRKLGISESNLRLQKDLVKKYKKDLQNFDKDFQDLKSKYKLELQSRDDTIASLRGQTSGGKTKVKVVTETKVVEKEVATIDDCDGNIIAYFWEDLNKRFKLEDPNIFKDGDEKFVYNQHFKVTGYIFTDSSGKIQIRKVQLKEVVPKEIGGEIEYRELANSDVTLVSSKFEYINKEENEKSLLSIFTLRPIVSFDTAVTPGIGLELINLGRYFDYLNFGFYGKLAFDVSDPFSGSLQNSRVGVGIAYHLAPPMINTNFAVGASISTPFNNLGQPILTFDLILYLTEDLNPFEHLK